MNRRKDPLAVLVLLLVFVAMGAPQTMADTVTLPAANESTEGNNANIVPFGSAPLRYQQVYDASEFPGPFFIVDMGFRPDGSFGKAFGDETITNIEIRLSTTASAVDALSTTFADNIGSDETLVHSGPLTLSSADVPLIFDIVIPFSTPFFYDPAEGNLLLEVKNFSGNLTFDELGFWDASVDQNDAVSRLVSVQADPNDITGSQDSLGLVTQFGLIPEPNSACLLVLGALLIMASRIPNARQP